MPGSLPVAPLVQRITSAETSVSRSEANQRLRSSAPAATASVRKARFGLSVVRASRERAAPRSQSRQVTSATSQLSSTLGDTQGLDSFMQRLAKAEGLGTPRLNFKSRAGSTPGTRTVQAVPNSRVNLTRNGVAAAGFISFSPAASTPLRAGYTVS